MTARVHCRIRNICGAIGSANRANPEEVVVAVGRNSELGQDDWSVLLGGCCRRCDGQGLEPILCCTRTPLEPSSRAVESSFEPAISSPSIIRSCTRYIVALSAAVFLALHPCRHSPTGRRGRTILPCQRVAAGQTHGSPQQTCRPRSHTVTRRWEDSEQYRGRTIFRKPNRIGSLRGVGSIFPREFVMLIGLPRLKQKVHPATVYQEPDRYFESQKPLALLYSSLRVDDGWLPDIDTRPRTSRLFVDAGAKPRRARFYVRLIVSNLRIAILAGPMYQPWKFFISHGFPHAVLPLRFDEFRRIANDLKSYPSDRSVPPIFGKPMLGTYDVMRLVLFSALTSLTDIDIHHGRRSWKVQGL